MLDLEKFLSEPHRTILESLPQDLLTEMVWLLVKEVKLTTSLGPLKGHYEGVNYLLLLNLLLEVSNWVKVL